jgi:tetratricopeptide (TPR) repeat protein
MSWAKASFGFLAAGAVVLSWITLPVVAIDKEPRGSEAAASGGVDREWNQRSAPLKSKADWKGLKALAEEYLTGSPRSFPALADLGNACVKLEELDCAIHAFRQAAAIQSKSELPWKQLAEIYRRTGQLAEAASAYQKALAINGKSAENWNRLGFVQHELGQSQLAVQAYRKALSLNPDYASAWFNLGIAHNSLKQYDKAVSALTEVTRPGNMNAAWSHLGYAQLGLKQYPQAVAAYEEAVRVDPDDSGAWFNLGLAYAQLGRKDMVRRVHASLRKLAPELASTFFERFMLP